jgi:hypothetical protein
MPNENPTPSTPTRAIPDFNNNGVPDYREGWFWSGAWRFFSWGVRTFAKPHTLIYKGVDAAERARADALAAGMVPQMPGKAS